MSKKKISRKISRGSRRGSTNNADLMQFAHAEDKWPTLVRGHDRCVRLGDFFDIARAPTISDVEIAVVFCDIRGFTSYCNRLQQRSLDSRIQNFLKDFLRIFSIAVLQEIWSLEPDGIDDELTHIDARLRDALVPATYKNLGDGVMLVWEIPADADIVLQGRITHEILACVFRIYESFGSTFSDPDPVKIDAYSDEVKDLKIGFGIARGHAWKLDFGHHLKPDYAGSIVNLAARLQDQARPEGIVCQYHFSQSLFDEMRGKQIGKVQNIEALKGLDQVKIISLHDKDFSKLQGFYHPTV